MSKYLIFIIFGILLFLLLNNTEKLNIGGPNIDDICIIGSNCNTPVGGTCVGQCMCMDDASGQLVNRCKPVRNNIVSVTGTEREGGGAERVGGGATGTERVGGGSQCAVETSSKCPVDAKPDEIFRRVLWKKSGFKKTWEERCFILFTNRIEYYKGEDRRGTIMYSNIISSDILSENEYQNLNIVLDTGRTHKLWAGEFGFLSSTPRHEELVEFQQNLISIFRSNYDICPDKQVGEIYRVVLYKIEGDVWIKVCVILFRYRIEYYINNTLDNTINYDSIRDLVINVEGEYNILSINENDEEVYKLWSGYYMWKDKIEELEKIQKFKNKIEEIINIELLFTPAVLNDDVKTKIIEYHDIYSLCLSVKLEYSHDMFGGVSSGEHSPTVHNSIITKLIDKFQKNPKYELLDSNNLCLWELRNNRFDFSFFGVFDTSAILYTPLLINVGKDGENIYILNLFTNTSVFETTYKYYNAAESLKITLYKLFSNNNLDNIKLVIIGHSSGASLLLYLIISLMETSKTQYWNDKKTILMNNEELKSKINSITCITTGLGLCDSYAIDKFQEYVTSSGEYIEYYDIMNMSGLPKNGDCWFSSYIDFYNSLIINKSSNCYKTDNSNNSEINSDFNIICKSILDILNSNDNLDDIPPFETLLSSIRYISSDISSDFFPVEYYQYLLDKMNNIRTSLESCKSETTLYNCKELFDLFHKHMNFQTFAILPDPYNNFFSYDKNELIKYILNNGNWAYIKEINDRHIISNLLNSLCLSGNKMPTQPDNYIPETDKPPRNTWRPDWGAHTLKSYHNRIMELQ